MVQKWIGQLKLIQGKADDSLFACQSFISKYLLNICSKIKKIQCGEVGLVGGMDINTLYAPYPFVVRHRPDGH